MPALSAQAFTDLATTSDGSVLYFASSLRQKATDQIPGVGKIFRVSGSGIELAAQPQCAPVPVLPGSCGLLAPEVSSDGKVLAYTFREFDPNGTLDVTQGVITPSPFFERRVDGRQVRISRNAKFVLAYSDVLSVAPEVIELATNITTALNGYSVFGDVRQAIADDGSVVLHDASNKTVLWKSGLVTPLSLQHQSWNARIDRAGRFVVYEWIDAQYHLSAYDVVTGVERPLWSEGTALPFVPPWYPFVAYYQASIADDGRQVLIQAGHLPVGGLNDLWILATDGSTTRQLTSKAGVAGDVLSGDGVIAYAVTLDNRILRINTVTVDRDNIVPVTPMLGPQILPLTVAPGDYTAVGGGGLAGAPIFVNGEPAWVIAANNGLAAIRIPWDVPIGQDVAITIPTASPFDPGSLIAIVAAANPHPWTSLPIHQDFSDFVNALNPATPAEIVHLYMTGLGLVAPLLPLDQPAPIGQLFRAVTPLDCTTGTGIAAPVFFAGVAPGQTWIYQVDVQIPAGAANGTLTCGGAPFPLWVAAP